MNLNDITKDKAIDRNYAMAIARQESAWNPQARSSKAGAAGLRSDAENRRVHGKNKQVLPGMQVVRN